MEIKDLYKIFQQSEGVCTDTRQIKKDVLFFALKGGNFNGNEFAERAIEMGASYAIIEEEKYKRNEQFILVKDVLKCLQDLAHFHRKQFTIPFIAITGSNGKTTTKELIKAVLATTYETHATKGNLNNHIGIPLTLLSIPLSVEIAIIEMGANHQKEIEGYCQYTEPTHGLITNIGKAHLEGFGGVEGVKKGKGELYDFLVKRKGEVFINSTDDILNEISKFNNPTLYPSKGDFYHCELIEAIPFVKFKSEKGEIVLTNLTGEYNFKNIAAALCIGKYFEVPDSIANKAVSTYLPDNNRSQFMTKGTNEILLDAYNANPSSMKAAIENFHFLKKKNKVLILGDMFELGLESEEEHKALGKLVKQLGDFQKVFFCGKNMHYAAKELSSSIYFENKSDLIVFLQKDRIEGATILIKGSRGIGLETILDIL